MKTSIIILTFNQLEYTKKCIESIRKYTTEHQYEIIIVDNHSTDGTIEWLQSQKKIKVIYNEENLGFPKGCNQGITVAQGDNILLLNNDTIVTSGWLRNLIICLYSDERIGAVGPVTNNCSYYQAIHLNFKNEQEMHRVSKIYNQSNAELWEERLKLVGYCFLVKRTVIDKVGMLDERFSPGNYEDDDLSFRIVLAGFKLMLCKDTFIFHFGSVSFKSNQTSYNALLKVNRKKFKEKWGIDPTYSLFIRQEIINLMDLSLKDKINVLEVGCACGATLLKIKSINPQAKLYGIELNERAAEIAKQVAKVSAQNIENEKLSYRKGFFDYIIFADVLEHLYNPGEVLKNILRYLGPNGRVLASIPNVMHFSIMKKLLAGHWTYEDAGILDRTHIRFFTLNEINTMFLQAGYSDMEYTSVNQPKNEQDQAFIKALTALGMVDEKQFDAYQYIVKASKKLKTEFELLARPANTKFEEIEIEKIEGEKVERQLIFLLRRIENGINIEENIKTFMSVCISSAIPTMKISKLIMQNMIQKQQLFNVVAWQFFKRKMVEEAIFLLEEAYKLDKQHSTTICNLAYMVNAVGEKRIALKLLHTLQKKDDQVWQLIKKIEGKVS